MAPEEARQGQGRLGKGAWSGGSGGGSVVNPCHLSRVGEASYQPICTLVSFQEAPCVPGLVIQASLPLEKSTLDVEGFFPPPRRAKRRPEGGFQQAAGWEVVLSGWDTVSLLAGRGLLPSPALPPSRYGQRRLGQACRADPPGQTPGEALGHCQLWVRLPTLQLPPS